MSVDTEIELVTGKYLDVCEPDPDAISLEAVAHGLANTGRFAGQSCRFYSVAEHAVLVARRLQETGRPLAIVLEGLHHDDPEAFLTDVTRPLKRRIPGYQDIEAGMARAVEDALGVPIREPMTEVVKGADTWALACEAHHLLPSQGHSWFCDGEYQEGDVGAESFTFGLPPAEAKGLWLEAHAALCRGEEIPEPQQTKSESVLGEAERLVSGARATSYGHPAEHSSRVAGAWRSVFGWDVDAYRVNLAMAIFKVARAAVGPHRDSLVDVAGYARTAEAVLAREGVRGFKDLTPPA
jgi:hypothetical protein